MKIRGYTYKITYISIVIALEYQTWYHINAKTHFYFPVGLGANCQIFIFIDINVNFRNLRTITEKLRGLPTKLHISHMLSILDYQAWNQIKA